MLVIREWLRRLQLKKLSPRADFVFFANVKRITFQSEWLFQIRELLILKSSRFSQRPRCHFPANGGVLIREAALESHQYVTAILDVVGDFLQKGIVCDVKAGNDEQLILREFRGGHVGKDDISAHIAEIE